jgi:hypothetical protein
MRFSMMIAVLWSNLGLARIIVRAEAFFRSMTV